MFKPWCSPGAARRAARGVCLRWQNRLPSSTGGTQTDCFARPPKQPLMVRTFLKIYGARLLFLFLQGQIKDIIITAAKEGVLTACTLRSRPAGSPQRLISGRASPSHDTLPSLSGGSEDGCLAGGETLRLLSPGVGSSGFVFCTVDPSLLHDIHTNTCVPAHRFVIGSAIININIM